MGKWGSSHLITFKIYLRMGLTTPFYCVNDVFVYVYVHLSLFAVCKREKYRGHAGFPSSQVLVCPGNRKKVRGELEGEALPRDYFLMT